MPEGYGPGFPWLQQFRKYSWWLSPAKQRTFVITGCWHKDDGSIETIDLLEYKTEQTENVTIEQMITWLNEGIMQPVSSAPL